MSGRRVCRECGATYHVVTKPPRKEGVCDLCGGELIIRADDTPETVKARLAVYHRETEPLTAFYAERGKLRLGTMRPPSRARPKRSLKLWDDGQ